MNEGTTDERVGRLAWTGLALCIAAGLFLRLSVYGHPVVGDELSTLWIVDHGFRETVDLVASDAEITPPLYFLLAWAATGLGSASELVRLPALIAGMACIPLVWMVGRRTLGNAVGLIAAALVAVSPLMTFFSANGRAYSLMMALLLASTLSMLAAIRTGRTRWWVAYGGFTCLAMYAHYTAGFILLGQFVWLMWTQPAVRKPGLLASLAAAALFVPWIPSMRSDFESPTTQLLQFLQPQGISEKLDAGGQLLVSAPVWTSHSAEWITWVLAAGAVLAAGVFALLRFNAAGRRNPWPDCQPGGVSLIVVLALAAPAAQIVLALLGTDILGARNLASVWPGVALVTAMILVAAGPALAIGLTLVAIVGLGTESVRVGDADVSAIPYDSAAVVIDEGSDPGDVVIDAGHYTPVPLTGLDSYLETSRPEYRLLFAKGDPPFIPFESQVNEPQADVDDAFRRARNRRVFVVTSRPPGPVESIFSGYRDAQVPPGWQVDSVRTFPGLFPQTVTVFSRERPR